MLTLNDGRSELWQWDTGRKLTVDADCSQVHFSNKVFGRSIDVDVVDGVAVIPDILLQIDNDLTAWAFVGTPENGYTKVSKTFKVNKRNKPADYVFTPTEQETLAGVVARLEAIEESQDPDAIKNAVEDYLANNPIEIDETDPTVPTWAKQTTKPKYTAKEVGAVAAVNGITPDENGNVQIEIGSGGDVDLTGYATEQYVQGYAQPKGNYLTEVPAGYAKTEDIPTKPDDIGAQPAGNYLTEVPDAYATKEFVTNKIAEAELGGEEVDLSGYAQKSELPTKVSQLQNDAGYLTEHQDISGKLDTNKLPEAINTALAQAKQSGEFNGNDGTSVTVKKVTESTEDGGSNVVEFSDGKTIVIKNGRKGNTGYTPQKNVDYWTPADQEDIVQQVITALGTPVFGTVDENKVITITTDRLVDGTYTLRAENADGSYTVIGSYTKAPEPTYTNLFDPSTATLNKRMSASSNAAKDQNGYVLTALIQIPATSVTGSSRTDFIAVPKNMWSGSANIYLAAGSTITQGMNDNVNTTYETVGNWAKIPLLNQWGNVFTCDGVVLSLHIKDSAISTSDIQNIEIYFNEIPE